MNDEYIPINDLQKLSHFLHGAHSACDHENSSATFHQAKHLLDEIINKIKLNNKPYFISKSDDEYVHDIKKPDNYDNQT